MRDRASLLRTAALVAVALVVATVAFGAPRDRDDEPLDPEATGPAGALGLVLFLGELGADVEVRRGAPPDGADAALVLRDRLDDDDRAATLAWVEAGGVLVTTGSSPLADGADDGPCPAVLADVAVVPVADDGQVVRRGQPPEGTCLGGLVRTGARGAGTVVALASVAPFTNALLDEADAAVLAGALLAPSPGTRVAVLDGRAVPATDEPRSLFDLVGRPVRLALLQGGLALALWVLWRARRLGRPVVESQPVAVAGSELVVAVGRLLDARRRPDEAAAALRADARRGLEIRLGVPAGAPTADLAAAVAARGSLDADRAAAALGDRPVTTDDDLLDVAADLDRIRTDLLGRTP